MDDIDSRQDRRWLTLATIVIAGSAYALWTLITAAVIAATIHAFDWIEAGRSAWNASLVTTIGSGVAIVVGITLWRRARTTIASGSNEAARHGASRLPNDAESATMWRAVEDLAVATGMPAPGVHVLPDEPGVNSFAVGAAPADAVLVVTRGCLRLEASRQRSIAAFGIARIAGGDARIDLQMSCAVAALLLPSSWARALRNRAARAGLARWRRVPLRLAAFVCDLLGAPGAWLARSAQAMLCRLRPFAADADAVLLADDPNGLDEVLRGIAASPPLAGLRFPTALEVAHALFVAMPSSTESRLRRLRGALTPDTHPSLAERRHFLGFTQSQVRRQYSFAESNLQQCGVAADAVLPQLRELEPMHVRRAARILAAIPEPVRAALRTPDGAHAVICGLLARGFSPRHRAQRKRFVETGDPHAVLAVRGLHDHLKSLDPSTWLALGDLAQPTFQAMSRAQRDALARDLRSLSNGDAESLEFFTALAWTHGLRGAARADVRLFSNGRSFDAASWPHSVALFLAIARLGNRDERIARRSFGDALRVVDVPAGHRIVRNFDADLPRAIEAALHHAAGLRPEAKRRFLLACVRAIAADSMLAPHDIEVVRAILKSVGQLVPAQLDPPDPERQTEPEPLPSVAEGRMVQELWHDELAAALATAPGKP